MIELEKYFNEDNWIKFSSLFENKQNEMLVRLKLAEILDNDIRLSNVIFQAVGVESIEWIDKKIPALDNLSPKECLSDKQLKNRLKECLMRMSW